MGGGRLPENLGLVLSESLLETLDFGVEVLDEALGHVPIAQNQLTVTGTITVRFVKPVPIARPLEARSWVDRIEGKKWFISGELVLASSGALLAEATGVWVARDRAGHFGGFERWLAEQT